MKFTKNLPFHSYYYIVVCLLATSIFACQNVSSSKSEKKVDSVALKKEEARIRKEINAVRIIQRFAKKWLAGYRLKNEWVIVHKLKLTRFFQYGLEVYRRRNLSDLFNNCKIRLENRENGGVFIK